MKPKSAKSRRKGKSASRGKWRKAPANSASNQTVVLEPAESPTGARARVPIDQALLTGIGIQRQGRAQTAERIYRRVLQVHQAEPNAMKLLVSLLVAREEFAEALPFLDRALADSPEDALLLFYKGQCCQQLDDLAGAEKAYRNVCCLQANNHKALNNLGNVLKDLDRFDQAEKVYRKALALCPDSAEIHNNLASVLCEGGDESRLDEAIQTYSQAVQLGSDVAVTHNGLGVAHRKKGQYETALGEFGRAIALDGSFVAARANLAKTLLDLGRLDDALAAFDQAVTIKGDYSELRYCQATAFLLAGRFAEGWRGYEHRWVREEQPVPERHFRLPIWDGQIRPSDRLLLWAEQGIGDEVMFASLVPELLRAGMGVGLEVDGRLVDLFRRSLPGVPVFARQEPPAPQIDRAGFTCQLPLGSLPGARGADRGLLESTQPYLLPDADRVCELRDQYLHGGDDLLVGISWRSGNAEYGKVRTLPLEQWQPLLACEGVTFVDLQYGDTAEERRQTEARTGVKIVHDDAIDPMADLEGFCAQVAAMDLVISIDNSTIHFAGAMGRPCWGLLASVPEWRWGMEGEQSPWYRTVRLMRQRRRGDWSDVLATAAEDLAAIARTASRPAGLEVTPTAAAESQTPPASQPTGDVDDERRKYQAIWQVDPYRTESPGLAALENTNVLDAFAARGVKTILDAGTGSGKAMRYIMEKAADRFEVRGMDIAPNCLDDWFAGRADQLLTVGCLWNRDDFPGRFDAIYCTDVMEHIPPDRVPETLANLAWAGRKAAFFAICLVDDTFGPAQLDEPLHLTVHSANWWMEELRRAGFGIIRHDLRKNADGTPVWLNVLAQPHSSD